MSDSNGGYELRNLEALLTQIRDAVLLVGVALSEGDNHRSEAYKALKNLASKYAVVRSD